MFWYCVVSFLAQRAIHKRRIVMFKKLSVFLNSQLKRRLENDPELRRSNAIKSALRFPGDLVCECLINRWGLLGEPTSLHSYVPSKLFLRAHEENNRLKDAFAKSSRIEATISFALTEGCVDVVVLFFPSGKNGRMYEIATWFSPDGVGHVGVPGATYLVQKVR